MQLNKRPDGGDKKAGRGDKAAKEVRAASALETELNKSLERLDHQMADTRQYLDRLDSEKRNRTHRRRKSDMQPNASPG